MSEEFEIEIDVQTPSYQEAVDKARTQMYRAQAVEIILRDLRTAFGGNFDGLVFQLPNGEWRKLVQKSIGYTAIPHPPPTEKAALLQQLKALIAKWESR